MGALALLTALLMGCALGAASRCPSACSNGYALLTTTEYLYTAGDATATITNSTQSVGSTEFHTIPATTVIPLGSTASQAAREAGFYQWYLDNHDMIDYMEACDIVRECRERYEYLDWQGIDDQAKSLWKYVDGDSDRATKYAMLYAQHLRQYTSTTMLTAAPATTAEIAVINGTNGGSPVTITHIPTTVSNTMYVHETTRSCHSCAQHTHMAKPLACQKGFNHNKTECRYQKCMWKHLKPLNITTVFQAAKYSGGCPLNTQNPWYTQPTSVTTPHWGTTQKGMLYYPHTPTITTNKHGKPSVHMATEMPAHDRGKGNTPLNAQTPPSCWDHGTCCRECEQLSAHGWFGSFKDPFNFRKGIAYFLSVGLITAALGLLSCLFCCCVPWLRRNKAKRDRAADEAAKREKVTVVDPATGQQTEVVTTTEGGSVDPALVAAATGAAVGAAAGPHRSGTTTGADTGHDGRGTMSRRAEEGRGRIQFAPGAGTQATDHAAPPVPAAGKPPGAGEKVVTTVTPAGESGKTAPATAVATTTAPEAEKKADAPAHKEEKVVEEEDKATKTATPAEKDPADKEEKEMVDEEKDKVTKTATPADQEKTAAEKEANAAQQKAETHDAAPVAVHDGAFDWRPTGSQVVDMGSMRGRKRSKQNGRPDLLNFGF